MLSVVERLVAGQEVRLLLGVNLARVTQLAKRPDFPPPVAKLAAGSIWTYREINEWARSLGREWHADALDTPNRAP